MRSTIRILLIDLFSPWMSLLAIAQEN